VPDIYDTYVPPIGPETAKIMILGESPGSEEVAAREPFVGRAGSLLNTFITSVGLSRGDIYLTNTVKFLPKFERGKDEYFWNGHWKGTGKKQTFVRTSPTMAYMTGIVELVEEIRRVKPNVVVPLGNYALWAVCQVENIFRNRGSILESTLIKGLKVIPTIHPAWYLRANAERAQALGNWDFMRVAEQSKFPGIRRKRREFIVNPTAEQIEDAIARYTDPGLDHLTCDTEWYSPDSLAYIGFADNDEEATCIVPDSMLAHRAYRIILGSSIPKVWQNAMFDAVALYRQGINVENVAHDTMLMWALNWGFMLKEPALPKTNGLDMIASVLTEEPYYKEDVEFVGKDERGQIYCCTDCVVTDEAYTKMDQDEFEITGTRRGYEISMSVMNTFIRAAQIGILVDREKLLKLRAEYIAKAEEKEEWLAKVTGTRLNPGSWVQVAKLVYDDMGIGKRFTERSTEQDVLMNIAATFHAEGGHDEEIEILKGIIVSRQNRNICSRYVTEKIIDRDERTRSNWNLTGTKNGRLSTTIPWWPGVALQTMPNEAREFCIADPGHVFVGWDLEQAEARVVAVQTRNFALLEAMDSGIDIHCMLAPVLNTTYEELMKKVKRVGKDACEERQLLKITRHASNYFISWPALMMRINREFIETNVGVDAKTAKILSSGYLEENPGLEPWWHTVHQAIKNNGHLTNAFGRRRNFMGRIRYGDHEHKDGIAYYPQSTIADLTTLSIADADKQLIRATPQTLVMTHIHDGGFMQVPEFMKDDTVDMVRRLMTRTMLVDGIELVVPVEVKVGYNWKDMEKVR
jgi:DNA polymerase I-like protein with 3'-5' exonuclease and polymerase domains/uracil-DNA glycosylase